MPLEHCVGPANYIIEVDVELGFVEGFNGKVGILQ